MGKNEKGATAVEYAILLAAIALAIYSGGQLLGRNLASKFADLPEQIQGQSPVQPPAEPPAAHNGPVEGKNGKHPGDGPQDARDGKGKWKFGVGNKKRNMKNGPDSGP